MPKSPFGVDQPEESLGFLLWQTTITWQRLIKKALERYDISHAQFVILAITLWLETTQQIPTQLVIVNQSKLDKMTVSKSLKKLATQGFVKRAEHDKDTRVNHIRLTSKGKQLASKLVTIVEKIDKDFFDSLKKSEQKTLIDLLNTLI